MWFRAWQGGYSDSTPTKGAPKQQAELLALAIHEVGGGFKKKDFRKAFQQVYATKIGRSQITGWPLKETFKTQLDERRGKESQ
jgi:hypothetical protein